MTYGELKFRDFVETERKEALELGQRLVDDSSVAVVTVAGGLGTRLGCNGPRGAVRVGPKSETFFELFANQIRPTKCIWAIMTGANNHEQTVRLFEGMDFFGLRRRQVKFFQQTELPMWEGGRVVGSHPSGHGDVYAAAYNSGVCSHLNEFGVKYISLCQVDNPLAPLLDSYFVGMHSLFGDRFSVKVVAKETPDEPISTVVQSSGCIRVLDWRHADEVQRFRWGYTGMAMTSLWFFEQIGKAINLFAPIQWIEKDGKRWGERMIFDPLRFIPSPLILRVNRSNEFLPVKFRTGKYSLEVAQKVLFERYIHA